MISDVETVFASADREGKGLTEFVSKNYDEKEITELETNIRSQLNSLKSEISEFMNEIEVPEIRSNLLSSSKERLDQMQDNIKVNIGKKLVQLKQMNQSTDFFKDLSQLENSFPTCSAKSKIKT